MPLDVLFGAIISLVAAIGFAFAPSLSYDQNDGTTITETGIRSDGLVLVLAALIAIGALAIAGLRQPGHASFPALIGFGACVIGLLAAGYTRIATVPQPGPLTRGWGLICSSLVMLVATWGAFRLWRIADHF